jgi:hypothetical protein
MQEKARERERKAASKAKEAARVAFLKQAEEARCERAAFSKQAAEARWQQAEEARCERAAFLKQAAEARSKVKVPVEVADEHTIVEVQQQRQTEQTAIIDKLQIFP